MLILGFNSDGFATDIDVIIEDRLTLTDRTREQAKRSRPIIYESLIKKLTKKYLVSFRQDVFVDEDNSVCVNYPTDKYASFNDCDRQYLDQLLVEETLYPVWAAHDDLSKVTTLGKSPELFGSLHQYVMGSDPGPCVQPCTQTHISAVYQNSDKMTDNPTLIFTFDPDVKVTTHAWPSFQPSLVLLVGLAIFITYILY